MVANMIVVCLLFRISLVWRGDEFILTFYDYLNLETIHKNSLNFSIFHHHQTTLPFSIICVKNGRMSSKLFNEKGV